MPDGDGCVGRDTIMRPAEYHAHLLHTGPAAFPYKGADKAALEWCNINWSQSEKGFVASPVKESLHEPNFLYDSAEELFARALDGRIISDPHDEIVAQILGEEEGEEDGNEVDEYEDEEESEEDE